MYYLRDRIYYYFDKFLSVGCSQNIQLCQKTINQCDDKTIHDLAQIYKKQSKYNEAIKLYQILADRGNVESLFQLGLLYDFYIKDESKMIKYYTMASDNGHTGAQNNLAICYRNGVGVEQNLEKTIELYQKGSYNGDALAKNNLAVCYEYGNGVPQNMKRAIELYRESSILGNSHAQNNLAICYKLGIEVESCNYMASELYTLSTEQDNKRAKRNILILYDEIDDLMSKVIRNLYGFGLEGKKDIKRASELYRQILQERQKTGQVLPFCPQSLIKIIQDEDWNIYRQLLIGHHKNTTGLNILPIDMIQYIWSFIGVNKYSRPSIFNINK